jgi:hypothetical protein
MALTKDQVAEKTIARLIQKGEKEDGLLKPDILSWIDEALQELGQIVADSLDSKLLRRSANVTITSGVGDLSSVGTDILFERISHAFSGAIIFKPVPHVGLLSLNFPTSDVGHYAITGKTIQVKDQAGSTTPNITMTITFNFVPTIGVGVATDLPSRLEGVLIDLLISMYKAKR